MARRASSSQARAATPNILGESPANRLLVELTVADWARLAVAARFQPEPLASLCGVELRLLERFFKRRFGSTPGAWMGELRCRLAAAVLAEGQILKEVAGPASGFTSAWHICHAFKKVFGLSPKRYVRAMYGRGGVRSVLRQVMTFFGNPFGLCLGLR